MAKKVKVNVFDDLRGSLQDAVAFERGERIDLRVVELPDPPRKLRARDIRNIRQSMNVTQVIFGIADTDGKMHLMPVRGRQLLLPGSS